MPLYYIGDMPRMLAQVHSWSIIKIEPHDLKNGDLIFAKSRRLKRLVTHVAWFFNGKLYHVCNQGLKSETIRKFFKSYEQPYGETSIKLLSNTDPRNLFSLFDLNHF